MIPKYIENWAIVHKDCIYIVYIINQHISIFAAGRDPEGLRALPGGGPAPAARAGAAPQPPARPLNPQGDGGLPGLNRACVYHAHHRSVKLQYLVVYY